MEVVEGDIYSLYVKRYLKAYIKPILDFNFSSKEALWKTQFY